MSTPTIAVVGAGLAGATAATAIRDHGFDGRVLLVGDEPGLPYERPPLSKTVLRGEDPPHSADAFDTAHYDEQQIELLTERTVRAINVATPAVELDDGEAIDCRAVILATGSAPRRLDVDGAELAGVHHLRTRADAVALRDALGQATRVAVVGAGWIGSEVAASARELGVGVVLIDPNATPLERVVGPTVGRAFSDLHADHGVQLRLGTGVARLEGTDQVDAVVLDDGRREPVDLVVAGIGASPRTALATAAGLEVAGGIIVDQNLRTGVPDVFAIGDVAAAWHPHYRTHLRVEHWANARGQGAVAGANAAGDDQTYTRLPYFFSDQYDLGLEYLGHASGDDELCIRGDLADRRFVAFWHRGGVISAAMNVNVWDVVEDVRTLIESGATVDLAALADERIPLAELADVGASS